MDKIKLTPFLTGVILGAGVGAGLALLLAPWRSEDVRQALRQQAPIVGNYGKKGAELALARLKEATDRGWRELTSKAGKGGVNSGPEDNTPRPVGEVAQPKNT
ncbi:MAG: YtxH domain-containing protein [Dehalococcoidia bacterium]|nr:YtxH domain-containing protein [Dehalococcoidia bacterium]